MGLKAAALLYFSGQLPGEFREILFDAPKYDVAALNIGLDVSSADTFQEENKLLHPKGILSPNVDAPEQGDESVHAATG
jgi:hypothetical protein